MRAKKVKKKSAKEDVCKYCKCDLTSYRETAKRDRWSKGHFGKDNDECPCCHRVHLSSEDMTKYVYRCPKCKMSAEMNDFFPGSLYGVDDPICPVCTIPGGKPVVCKRVKA